MKWIDFDEELFLNHWTKWKLFIEVNIVLLMMHLNNAIISLKFELFNKIWIYKEFCKVMRNSQSKMNWFWWRIISESLNKVKIICWNQHCSLDDAFE